MVWSEHRIYTMNILLHTVHVKSDDFFVLKVKDYKIAYNLCSKLMSAGYMPIWEECKNLAECDEFQDIQSR